MINAREMIQKRLNSVVGPKRGDALFEGTDYPQRWEDYIGQDEAKDFLRAASASAKFRRTRMDHVLIASGTAGIGKSALVRLIAQEMSVGLLEVQGQVDVTDGIRALSSMHDGDILFWDEIHNSVSSGRAKAEWLLSYLQDGVIVTPSGVTPVPNVTVIAATTDAQRLPEAILSRFTVKPVLESYSEQQAEQIVQVAAIGIFASIGLTMPSESNRKAIVQAANCNPRTITQLLKTLRDSVLARGLTGRTVTTYPLDDMYTWSGLTADGLDRLAQLYLMTLYTQPNFRAGEKSLAQALGEPTPPRHTEKLLIQKGLVRIAAQGRELTNDGAERVVALVEQGALS
jgi:Holliday junction resolvasome RuvABC ATP-dependent DNA helicase subunit